MNEANKIVKENRDTNTIINIINASRIDDNNLIKNVKKVDVTDANNESIKKAEDEKNVTSNDDINNNITIGLCDTNSSKNIAIATPQIWYYQDPQLKIHGPYENSMMKQWYERSYLTPALPIKLNHWVRFHPLGVVFINNKPFMPSVFTSEPPPPGK
jgi:hypothetical protein